MQYAHINLFVKLLISIIALLSVSIMSDDVAYAVANVDFINYVTTDECKVRITLEITERIKANQSDFSDQSGQYCIGKPYSLSYYNVPTKSFISSNKYIDNVKYSKVYKDDKLVGLIRYMNTIDTSNMGIEYFIIPEWVGEYYQDVPLFCGQSVVEKDGEESLRYSDNNFIYGIINNKSYVMFNGYDTFYGYKLSTDFYSAITITGTTEDLQSLNDTNIQDVMYTTTINFMDLDKIRFDYYLIKNKYGKVLTYDNGKYLLSDYTGDINQHFYIKTNQDGTYSFSAICSGKKMSVNCNTHFLISSAYLNEHIYQIIDNDSHRFIKANETQDKAVVGSYGNNYSTLWYIEGISISLATD